MYTLVSFKCKKIFRKLALLLGFLCKLIKKFLFYSILVDSDVCLSYLILIYLSERIDSSTLLFMFHKLR